MIDRFRSLPMPRSAVLSGRTVSDVVYNTGLLVVLMATGLAFGWRVHRGFGDLIAALVLLMCFMFAMAWVGVLLGLRVSSVEVAQQLGLLVIFPLTLVSNAFVPTRTLPAALRPVAVWNPFVSGGFAGRHPIALAAAWIAMLLIVFAPLAVRRYQAIDR